ncbi:hypothetical protein BO71DRAFT_432127 [Aspergillus ellipticus CBS 707.79]|uniref:Uncharacterized protein n=1 Tax=Aspergillus ellipticus CBS 707.79 TaxID=1448320 RepID=A0A319D4K6_9EURO|nr:hypothetical protein BO71DRAFT_432127 [Aspergillus ellipticus CBS 707.79]
MAWDTKDIDSPVQLTQTSSKSSPTQAISHSNSNTLTPNISVETHEHLERRTALLQLEKTVEAFQGHELNVSGAKRLGIDLHQMALDGTSNRVPSFFTPHSRLREPDSNRLNHIHSTLDDEDTCFTDPVDRARQIEPNWSLVGDYTPYKSVYGYEQPKFGTFRMTDIHGGGVLVISPMGKCGRVIEAYFNGKNLVLGCTGLYNFRDQTSLAMRTCAEWYLSNPMGNIA